ncbi:MAG: 5'/3'-nucleotidase SurE [Calditrichia bacterium]|nr:5'/3'-nucleotidase SurE [Calditrichia bacterium]
MKKNSKYKILITNDDGIYAPGIKALVEAIKPLGEVVVVAPDMEKSAVGHAITISDPLRVTEIERDGSFFGYAVNGTPADCVKLAVKAILEYKPDMVVSGINLGPNTGINAIYSGTVSAATEGTFMGIPSFAVSLTSFEKVDFSYSQKIAAMMVEKVMQNGLPQGTILNINIPPLPEAEIKGILVTRQGKGKFDEFFDKRVDPFKRVYYWLSGKKMILDTEKDVDDVAVNNKYVAVTPLHYDLTDYETLKELKNWKIEKGI